MGENENSKSSKLLEAIIVISIPIIGYTFAFLSELSYFKYFKMPSELIEISFSNLFNSVLISVMVLLCFFSCSFIMLVKDKDIFATNKERIFIVYIIPLLSFALFCLSLFLYRRKMFEILFIIFCIFTIIVSLVIDIFKFMKQYRTLPKISILSFGIFILFLLFLLVFINGKRIAETQKDYYILKTSPERIILRMYKDITIVAPFDRAKKIIDPTYSILKTPDITSPIKLERIGEMKVMAIEK